MNAIGIFEVTKKIWYSMPYSTEEEKIKNTNDINTSAMISGFKIEIKYLNDTDLQKYINAE